MQDDDDGDFDVYLTDCSQNGTFVNGELVGKWKVSTHRQHVFPKYYITMDDYDQTLESSI